MAFISQSTLLGALADRLLLGGPNDLPPHFATSIVPAAATAAYQEIVGRLHARGYTKAQVDLWDRGAEFQLSIGLYWCMVNGGMYGGMDPASVRALDRRGELDSVIVAVNGAWTRPADAGNPGMVVSSGPSATGSFFNFPDPDDGRLGTITQW